MGELGAHLLDEREARKHDRRCARRRGVGAARLEMQRERQQAEEALNSSWEAEREKMQLQMEDGVAV